MTTRGRKREESAWGGRGGGSGRRVASGGGRSVAPRWLASGDGDEDGTGSLGGRKGRWEDRFAQVKKCGEVFANIALRHLLCDRGSRCKGSEFGRVNIEEPGAQRSQMGLYRVQNYVL